MANKSNGNGTSPAAPIRCAIYTRKSTEEGLGQDFNSLDAQRDSGTAYIRSQAGEGWILLPEQYDDGGYTSANMERAAGCWPMFRPRRSTACWSTRWTG